MNKEKALTYGKFAFDAAVIASATGLAILGVKKSFEALKGKDFKGSVQPVLTVAVGVSALIYALNSIKSSPVIS